MLTDHKLDAEDYRANLDFRFEFVGQFDSECAAVPAWNQALRDAVERQGAPEPERPGQTRRLGRGARAGGPRSGMLPAVYGPRGRPSMSQARVGRRGFMKLAAGSAAALPALAQAAAAQPPAPQAAPAQRGRLPEAPRQEEGALRLRRLAGTRAREVP